MAIAMRRPRFTGEEAICRVHKMHIGVREDNPSRHSEDISGARFFQRKRRFGTGEPFQRYESLQFVRSRSWLLPRFRIYRWSSSYAGIKY